MAEPGDPQGDLTQVLRALRAGIERARFPLALPSAGPAEALAASVRAQLDEYLLPRLANPDTPLLVAVGGPTGSGKSTLVNSLIRAPATAAGILRPTTRSPVLVCHPADATWFRGQAVLSGLTRTSSPTDDPDQLQLVTAQALDAGCAYLDTPDTDSVVGQSRAVAHRLLAAADVWLFVVTAARYADAVPWERLYTGQERGTAVALVLDRVPEHAAGEVVDHLTEMLNARGLADTPLFVVVETQVDGYGLLPEADVEALRGWFDALAADATVRAELLRRNRELALASLGPAAETLAAAVDEQVAVAEVLAEQAGMAYGAARSAAERGIRDGTLLGGQVMARWQEFVATGEWLRTPLAAVGRSRDRLAVAVGRPSGAGQALAAALESGLVALVRSVAIDAAEQTYRAWHAHVGAAPLLACAAGENLAASPLTRTGPASDDEHVARLVRQWRDDVRDMVGREAAAAPGRPTYAAEATAALVMMAASAPDVAPAVVSDEDREVLAALLADETVRSLAGQARDDLLDRIAVLLDAEAARYLDRLAGLSPDRDVARQLREAVVALQAAGEDQGRPDDSDAAQVPAATAAPQAATAAPQAAAARHAADPAPQEAAR